MAVHTGPKPADKQTADKQPVAKSLDELGNLFKQTSSSTGTTMTTPDQNQSVFTPPANPGNPAPSQQSMGEASPQDQALRDLQALLQGMQATRLEITEAVASAEGKATAVMEETLKMRSEFESARAEEAIRAQARDAETEALKKTVKDMQAAASKKPTTLQRVVNFNTIGSVAGLLAFGFVAVKEYKERTADTAEV